MAAIALVSEELSTHGLSGGIGAAIYELALVLVEHGHDVDIIYCPIESLKEDASRSVQSSFIQHGIVVRLVKSSNYVWNTSGVKERSYAVYRHILDTGIVYDFVHFHDFKGLGFFCLSAKHQGISFSKTALIVQIHGPTRWTIHANKGLFTHADQLLVDFMERACIRLADHVVSPSQYLVEWLLEKGFSMPAIGRVHVIKNVNCQSVRARRGRAKSENRVQVGELIFFGRHERRKGLVTFCDALDLIEPQLSDAGISVCFVGKLGEVNGLSSGLHLNERARKWGFPIEFRLNFDRSEAISFLASRRGALVVIPSSAENSPYTVVEALAVGRPVLTSREGGAKELIAEEFHDEAVVDTEPEALAERIIRLVTDGVRVPRFAESSETITAKWLDFHAQHAPSEPSNEPKKQEPKVVVGIVHFERPTKIVGAIMSVMRQTYANIELIVVDDGSRSAETLEALPKIERLVKRVGGRFIRRKNGYLGAARNTIARESSSEYILFLDDDDLLFPQAVERLVQSALASGADIVNCLNVFMDTSVRNSYELCPETFHRRVSYVPLGGPTSLAHLGNHFGAATALIRRRFFDAVKGYTEVKQVGYEDYEFYLRSAQAGGQIVVLPEPLYLYEVGKPSMASNTSRLVNKSRVVSAIDFTLSGGWHDAVELAAGRESIEDQENMNRWLISSSPQRELLERIAATGSDLTLQVATLAEHAVAIGSSNAAAAWRDSLSKPDVTFSRVTNHRGTRSVVALANGGADVTEIESLDLAGELLALWKLNKLSAAAEELARAVGRLGEVTVDIVKYANLIAGSPALTPAAASILAKSLASAWVSDDLALDLKSVLALLALIAGQRQNAEEYLAELERAEAEIYTQRYGDLWEAFGRQAHEQGLNHFRDHGYAEGRTGFELLLSICQKLGSHLGCDITPWSLRRDLARVSALVVKPAPVAVTRI